MRMAIWFVALCVSAATATTIQPPAQYPCEPDEAVATFLYAREALSARPVTPEVDAPQPAQYAGRAIELRARLRGRLVINADDAARRQTKLRLELLNGQPLYCTSACDVKGLHDGDRVRVILEVPADQPPDACFQLRAIVLEYDLPSEKPVVPMAPPEGAAVRRIPIQPAPTPAPPARQVLQPSDLNLAIPPELRGGPKSKTPGLARFDVRVPSTPRPDRAGAWDPVGNLGYPVVEASRLEPWKAFIGRCNSCLTDAQRDWIARWVIYYSAVNGVDHRLMFAMIKCESDFDPFCVSRAGAVGVTQLMPCNVQDFRVSNKWNVQEQIRAGVEHFKEMLDMYKDRGNYEQFALAAASYNAGPNRVKRDGGIPNIAETRNYVKKLGDLFYKLWKDGYP